MMRISDSLLFFFLQAVWVGGSSGSAGAHQRLCVYTKIGSSLGYEADPFFWDLAAVHGGCVPTMNYPEKAASGSESFGKGKSAQLRRSSLPDHSDETRDVRTSMHSFQASANDDDDSDGGGGTGCEHDMLRVALQKPFFIPKGLTRSFFLHSTHPHGLALRGWRGLAWGDITDSNGSLSLRAGRMSPHIDPLDPSQAPHSHSNLPWARYPSASFLHMPGQTVHQAFAADKRHFQEPVPNDSQYPSVPILNVPGQFMHPDFLANKRHTHEFVEKIQGMSNTYTHADFPSARRYNDHHMPNNSGLSTAPSHQDLAIDEEQFYHHVRYGWDQLKAQREKCRAPCSRDFSYGHVHNVSGLSQSHVTDQNLGASTSYLDPGDSHTADAALASQAQGNRSASLLLQPSHTNITMSHDSLRQAAAGVGMQPFGPTDTSHASTRTRREFFQPAFQDVGVHLPGPAWTNYATLPWTSMGKMRMSSDGTFQGKMGYDSLPRTSKGLRTHCDGLPGPFEVTSPHRRVHVGVLWDQGRAHLHHTGLSRDLFAL